MTLPFDLARCAGVGFEDEGGEGWIWREGCEDCRRREPGNLEQQAHMTPPAIIVFECESRIPGGLAEGGERCLMLPFFCCPTLGKVGARCSMLAYIVVPRTGPQNITKNNSLGVAVRD